MLVEMVTTENIVTRHIDIFCDDYSSITINRRDMGFSPKGSVSAISAILIFLEICADYSFRTTSGRNMGITS